MKTALVICEKVQEINRLRRYFDNSFTVKATGNIQSAVYVAQTASPDIILYNLGQDFRYLFSFYRELRETESTSAVPLIVMAEMNILKTLTDSVTMRGVHLASLTASEESIRSLVTRLAPKEGPGNEV